MRFLYRYGVERDLGLKLHPALVPYEFLSDSEKEYDRVMCTEALKVLLMLGYTIELNKQKRDNRFLSKILHHR